MTHQAIQFLEALGKTSVFVRSWVGKGYPDVPNLYKGNPGRAYNVLCDRSGHSLSHQRWDKSEWPRLISELERQNSPEFKPTKTFPFQVGGWCPYLIPNNGGHKKDDITDCPALFIEFDSPISKEEAILKLKAFSLPYSILIESRAGWHVYFLLKKPTTPKLWQQMQWRLIEYFESDSGIADFSRCMRLPAFYHLKEGAEPFLINMVECHSDRTYTLEDFDQVLPEVPEWRLKLERHSKPYEPIRGEEGEQWDIRNFKHVLKHYQESSRREWDTCQCPVHGGDGHSRDSLHINSRTGAFHCWSGCEAKDIYKEVCRLAGWERPKKEWKQVERETAERAIAPTSTEPTKSKQKQQEEKLPPNFHEVLDQIDLLEQAITNDSELSWAVQNFAYENELMSRGFSGARLLQFARARRDGNTEVEDVDAHDILDEHAKPQFLISSNLLKGAVVALAATGGCGKTSLVYDFAKHIALAKKWSGYKVQQGRSLIVQCDEPKPNISQKLRIAKFREIPRGMIRFITKWRFSQFRQLERRIRDEGFSFVVIDSWTAAHAGLGIDLTKSNAGDNAYLLRDLAEDTGCCIVILHHLNKMGDFRDSSALWDNVSECWKMTKGQKEDQLQSHQRILTIEKSRSDLIGRYLLQQNAADYSWRHLGPMEAPDFAGNDPLITRILSWMEASPNSLFSARRIAEIFDCDEAKAQIELQRLENHGEIESQWVAYSKSDDRSYGWFEYYYPGDEPVKEAIATPAPRVIERVPEPVEQYYEEDF